MPTRPQTEKFAKFQEEPLNQSCIELVKATISVADLSLSDRGRTWGVTVCPDPESLIRLNVGNVAQMSVRRNFSPKADPSGEVHFVVMAVKRSTLGPRGVPRGLWNRTGFVQHVDDSIFIYGPMERWATKLLKKKRVALAVKSHVDEALRTLPDSNWHNPLVDSLL